MFLFCCLFLLSAFFYFVISLNVIFYLLLKYLKIKCTKTTNKFSGCTQIGSKRPRYAWDLPSKPDGFRLGNLLDRKKAGFEKLEQHDSDDEKATAVLTT